MSGSNSNHRNPKNKRKLFNANSDIITIFTVAGDITVEYVVKGAFHIPTEYIGNLIRTSAWHDERCDIGIINIIRIPTSMWRSR